MLGHVHRVLSGHGVGHQKDFRGLTLCLILTSSAMSSSSMWRRPAVSRIRMSAPAVPARARAPGTYLQASGSCPYRGQEFPVGSPAS